MSEQQVAGAAFDILWYCVGFLIVAVGSTIEALGSSRSAKSWARVTILAGLLVAILGLIRDFGITDRPSQNTSAMRR